MMHGQERNTLIHQHYLRDNKGLLGNVRDFEGMAGTLKNDEEL